MPDERVGGLTGRRSHNNFKRERARPVAAQDHRFIKRITGPMMGFKTVHSAAASLAGIETAHMIRKGQLGGARFTAFQQFAALAA